MYKKILKWNSSLKTFIVKKLLGIEGLTIILQSKGGGSKMVHSREKSTLWPNLCIESDFFFD